MKIFDRNYFKDNYLYQWDIAQDVFLKTKIDINGEFCLDKKGMALLNKFKAPNVELQGTVLVVKEDNKTAKIELLNERFAFPNINYVKQFSAETRYLKAASKFMADSNIDNKILSSLCVRNGKIYATNSFIACNFKYEGTKDIDVAVAPSFIKAVLASKPDDEIIFNLNDNNIMCTIDNTTYVGRLYAAKYPDMEKLFNARIEDYRVLFIDKGMLQDILSYSVDNNSYVIFNNDEIKINRVSVNTEEPDFKATIQEGVDTPFSLSYSQLNVLLSSINEEDVNLYIEYPKSGRGLIRVNNDFIICPCFIS